MDKKINFAFFGSSQISLYVLNELEISGQRPIVIITLPDKPQGRHMTMTPTPVKEWAVLHGIPVLDPQKLNDDFVSLYKSYAQKIDFAIVASYGKILPEKVLGVTSKGNLNFHPSLLPKYRGPSPIRSAILNDDRNTGVSIILMDKEMDHGPILAQEKIELDSWPIANHDLENRLGTLGGKMLVKLIPSFLNGEIKPIEQNHHQATFTKFIKKEDGLLDLNTDPYKNFLKINAFSGWPGTYFFTEKNGKKIRVKIVSASFKDNILLIEKVIPEGSKEMKYEDFLRGFNKDN